MNKIYTLIFLLLALPSISLAQSDYWAAIKQQRAEKDKEMKRANSPLSYDLKKGFKGLPYFPIDTNFRVKASFEKEKEEIIFKMPASGIIEQTYKVYGILTFQLANETHQLIVYQNLDLIARDKKYKNYLFIPFKDLTSGQESYGGGRYLDTTTEEVEADTFYLDFNEAYNPYCVYSHLYSCPIPPKENHLQTRIEAGEKNLKAK